MPPKYPFPWYLLYQLAGSALSHRKRAFHQDVKKSVSRLKPPLLVINPHNVPIRGPKLITVNHYFRPGFRAWWLAMSISTAVPQEIHWVITSGWTFPDVIRSHLITPLTSKILRHIAMVYNFTNMPPMPPKPEDVYERAAAVRKILSFAKKSPYSIIGIAPEGRDPEYNDRYSLANPPSGVGRLIAHLAQLGFEIVPVAAYESEERYCLNFGAGYRLNIPSNIEKANLDQWVSHSVMKHISDLLPDFNV